MKTFGSILFAIFLTLFGIWWAETSLTHSFWIAVIMSSSGIVGILFLILRYTFYRENKVAYSDEVEKLKKILSKVRKSRKDGENHSNSQFNENQ